MMHHHFKAPHDLDVQSIETMRSPKVDQNGFRRFSEDFQHKTNLLYIEDLDRLLSEGRASVFMLGTLILFKAFIL